MVLITKDERWYYRLGYKCQDVVPPLPVLLNLGASLSSTANRPSDFCDRACNYTG
jgi:hypothetical protein